MASLLQAVRNAGANNVVILGAWRTRATSRPEPSEALVLNFGKVAAFVLVLLEFPVSKGDRLAVLISEKSRDSFRGRF
jgi:hypothetical protein